jgi:hypothetical protein
MVNIQLATLIEHGRDIPTHTVLQEKVPLLQLLFFNHTKLQTCISAGIDQRN